MNKQIHSENEVVRTIERKYGVDLRYKSDQQLHTFLKKSGVPSLSKLLKLTIVKKKK